MRGKDVLVLAVEKKAVPQLQIDRTIRKIAMLDSHIAVTFAGFSILFLLRIDHIF